MADSTGEYTIKITRPVGNLFWDWWVYGPDRKVYGGMAITRRRARRLAERQARDDAAGKSNEQYTYTPKGGR